MYEVRAMQAMPSSTSFQSQMHSLADCMLSIGLLCFAGDTKSFQSRKAYTPIHYHRTGKDPLHTLDTTQSSIQRGGLGSRSYMSFHPFLPHIC